MAENLTESDRIEVVSKTLYHLFYKEVEKQNLDADKARNAILYPLLVDHLSDDPEGKKAKFLRDYLDATR